MLATKLSITYKKQGKGNWMKMFMPRENDCPSSASIQTTDGKVLKK